MSTDTLVLLRIFSSFWMKMWMKNMNNFQKAKVQPQGVAYLALLMKVLLIKKHVYQFILALYISLSYS